jgi:hypothetical protein
MLTVCHLRRCCAISPSRSRSGAVHTREGSAAAGSHRTNDAMRSEPLTSERVIWRASDQAEIVSPPMPEEGLPFHA